MSIQPQSGEVATRLGLRQSHGQGDRGNKTINRRLVRLPQLFSLPRSEIPEACPILVSKRINIVSARHCHVQILSAYSGGPRKGRAAPAEEGAGKIERRSEN